MSDQIELYADRFSTIGKRLREIDATLKYYADTLKAQQETIQKLTSWQTHLEGELIKLRHGITDPPKGRNSEQKYARSAPLI